MAEGQTNAPTPGATRNRVPEMIQRMKASKATGKFTYHAGRYVNVSLLFIYIKSIGV